jgi:hypothetical protein
VVSRGSPGARPGIGNFDGAIAKHLKVLERAGLIARGRDAQRRPCKLVPAPLKAMDTWIERYRELWEESSRAAIVSAEVDFRVGGSYRYVFRAWNGGEFSWVERDGVTTMTVAMRFSSQAVRDMVVATGMESGAAESYDNLAALVRAL